VPTADPNSLLHGITARVWVGVAASPFTIRLDQRAGQFALDTLRHPQLHLPRHPTHKHRSFMNRQPFIYIPGGPKTDPFCRGVQSFKPRRPPPRHPSRPKSQGGASRSVAVDLGYHCGRLISARIQHCAMELSKCRFQSFACAAPRPVSRNSGPSVSEYS